MKLKPRLKGLDDIAGESRAARKRRHLRAPVVWIDEAAAIVRPLQWPDVAARYVPDPD